MSDIEKCQGLVGNSTSQSPPRKDADIKKMYYAMLRRFIRVLLLMLLLALIRLLRVHPCIALMR
jgi:hypothetical protein